MLLYTLTVCMLRIRTTFVRIRVRLRWIWLLILNKTFIYFKINSTYFLISETVSLEFFLLKFKLFCFSHNFCFFFRNCWLYFKNVNFSKNIYLTYSIYYSLRDFWGQIRIRNLIRMIWSDPDPTKLFGYGRIRICNTGTHCNHGKYQCCGAGLLLV